MRAHGLYVTWQQGLREGRDQTGTRAGFLGFTSVSKEGEEEWQRVGKCYRKENYGLHVPQDIGSVLEPMALLGPSLLTGTWGPKGGLESRVWGHQEGLMLSQDSGFRVSAMP